MKKNTYLYVIDFLIITLSFFLLKLFRHSLIIHLLRNYYLNYILLLIIWIPISFLFGKYSLVKSSKPFSKIIVPIIYSNILILGIIIVIILLIHISGFSGKILLETYTIATITEIIVFNFLHYFGRLNDLQIDDDSLIRELRSNKEATETWGRKYILNGEVDPLLHNAVKNEITEQTTLEVYNQLDKWVNLSSPYCLILATNTRFKVKNCPDIGFKGIINLKRINDIRYLNKFFETVNEKLPLLGVFIGLVETKDLRKLRILRKFPIIINYLYYAIDFIFKRIFPKFILTKYIYFSLTNGRNRVLSKAETFGRLYSCGFEVLDEVVIQGNLFFLTRKVKEPYFDKNPTYGPLIKLKRIGKDGKIIKVYKLRTMHPYAEYLQDYIYKKNSLEQGGKFKNDFRVTTLGRFFRKFWIDELPMLYNLINGDIKLIGVRPLSQHYFSLYSEELKAKRIKFKPGLIPPFYVDMPKSFEEIMASELKYLDAFEKHPIRTDLYYFFKTLYNIILKNARSK